MTKRLVSAAASLAAVGAAALAVAPSAMAAPNGGGCQLTGTATFHTPLQATGSNAFTYDFSGTLSNCHSSTSGSPSGGKVFTPATASGTGSCVMSTTSGNAVVSWNDGDTTVISYSTTGAAAAVVQTGTVISSLTVGTPPNTTTYTTNEPATPTGDSADGLLAFTPPSPTSCQSGVTSASINGVDLTGGM